MTNTGGMFKVFAAPLRLVHRAGGTPDLRRPLEAVGMNNPGGVTAGVMSPGCACVEETV